MVRFMLGQISLQEREELRRTGAGVVCEVRACGGSCFGMGGRREGGLLCVVCCELGGEVRGWGGRLRGWGDGEGLYDAYVSIFCLCSRLRRIEKRKM